MREVQIEAAIKSGLIQCWKQLTVRQSLVVRQSDNLGYWSLFTCRSRKAGLIRHPNLSHGQTTRTLLKNGIIEKSIACQEKFCTRGIFGSERKKR